MPLPVNAMRNALGSLIRTEVTDAAGSRAKLSPFVKRAAKHVIDTSEVNSVVDAAMTKAMRAWAKQNQKSGRGAAVLSKKELAAIAKKDHALGVLTGHAAAIVLRLPVVVDLTAAEAAAKAKEGLIEYLKTDRIDDADWTRYFPTTWEGVEAGGSLAKIDALLANPEALESRADSYLWVGRGPYDLYTEIEVSKRDGKVLRAFIEID